MFLDEMDEFYSMPNICEYTYEEVKHKDIIKEINDTIMDVNV